MIDTVEFAKALADETRQKIMSICCCEFLSVNDIVDQLDVAQPTVSHHLKILKQAGLVRSERRGKQILYTLNQERLAQGLLEYETLTGEEIERVMRGEPPHAPDGGDGEAKEAAETSSVTAIPKTKPKPSAPEGGMEPEPTA